MEVQPEDLAGALRVGYAFCEQDADDIVDAVKKVQQLELQIREADRDRELLNGEIAGLKTVDIPAFQNQLALANRLVDSMKKILDASYPLVEAARTFMETCRERPKDGVMGALYDAAKNFESAAVEKRKDEPEPEPGCGHKFSCPICGV